MVIPRPKCVVSSFAAWANQNKVHVLDLLLAQHDCKAAYGSYVISSWAGAGFLALARDPDRTFGITNAQPRRYPHFVLFTCHARAARSCNKLVPTKGSSAPGIILILPL